MNRSIISAFQVTSVFDAHATGLPSRILRLSFNFLNPLDVKIIIVSSWASVSSIGGSTIAEGSLLRIHSKELEPKEQGYGEVAIPMTPWTLNYIEGRRAGGDVDFQVRSELIAFPVHGPEETSILASPIYAHLDQGRTGLFNHEIPQSEWIKILRALQWSELELLEIPSRNLRSLAIPPRALRRFEEAQEHHRKGHWPEVMASCRKSFEALIKEVSGEDDMSLAPSVLVDILGEDARASALNKVISGFNGFLHLARHEQQPPIEIGPAEANFAIRVTGAILGFIGEYRQ